jgi:archaellum component FlaC
MTDIDDFDNQISNDLDQFDKDINSFAKKDYDTK